jgi:hypothetical protein
MAAAGRVFAATRVVGSVAAAGMVLLACTSRPPEARTVESSREAAMATDSRGADSLIELTLTQPLYRQPVATLGAALRTLGFLRIEVVTVTNPQKLALSIEVRQAAPSQADSLLGMVSLFPADNPGTFVVATGGHLRADGTLTVRLVSPDSGSAREAVRVSMRPLVLTAR